MQDNITKEIIVKAKKEDVYAAITDPKKITQWFPDAIEGTLEEGQQPILIFDHDGTLYRSKINIESAKPFEYFSYRWVPGANGNENDDLLTVPTTLVEFFLEEQEEGTKITVKESGFASLPTEIAEQSFNQNSGGWNYMVGRLEDLLSTK